MVSEVEGSSNQGKELSKRSLVFEHCFFPLPKHRRLHHRLHHTLICADACLPRGLPGSTLSPFAISSTPGHRPQDAFSIVPMPMHGSSPLGLSAHRRADEYCPTLAQVAFEAMQEVAVKDGRLREALCGVVSSAHIEIAPMLDELVLLRDKGYSGTMSRKG
jgi:hypothetical protein